MGIDQRKHVRTPAQLIVQYSDRRLFYTEFVSDLSLGGIKIEGIVAWSKKSMKNKFKYEIGVRFDGLSHDQKSQITDIITSIYWETNPTH
jgi:hypothetical protein